MTVVGPSTTARGLQATGGVPCDGRARRWAWVVTGVVVLGAGGAIYVLTSQSRSGPTPSTNQGTPSTGISRAVAAAQFSYGFDFAQRGPYNGPPNSAEAVTSARRVISSMSGLFEDTAIMDWGLPDPEPSPGHYDLSGIGARVKLIEGTGGIPVITLCTAPDWMKNSRGPDVAPSPTHYRDFADLAARIAQSYPQVKYFVVWNEFKGFWDKAKNDWNAQGYTTIYNDVYRAVKQVRPDAQIGGPYAVFPTLGQASPKSTYLTPHGPWGYVDQRTLDAFSYWLSNAVGADFVAVDGRDFLPNGSLFSDPLTATEKYAAIDQWITQRTTLPIWWMESHVQPDNSGWSAGQAAAIRVAALVQMATSGARVGMQWQPQSGEGIADEGLWTATESPSGGRPTALAEVLPRVLSVLRKPVSEQAGQPPGVLVAAGAGGTIALNTTLQDAMAIVDGKPVALMGGEIKVL